jgi:NADPH-dependent 7-cyano-7-deazaguanine reductase QueF
MQKIFGQVMNGPSMITPDWMTIYIEYGHRVSAGD